MKNNILIFFILSFLLIGNNLSAQTDSDGDGIINSIDLDDDNDGILDTTENPCTSVQVQWKHNASSGQSDFATFGNDTTTTSPHFTSANNISFGAGLNETTDNYAYTYLLRNATATTFAAAKTGNDYAQVSYTPSKKMYLNGINFGYWSPASSPELNCGNFKMAVEYSTSAAFTSPTVLLQDIQVGALVSGGYTTVNNAISKLLLQSGTTYYFRVYFYDEQNTDPNNRVRLDDLYFPHCLFVDTDNDGTEDYLDLDSDGDNCPDAVEGGDNITRAMLNGSNAIGTNISGTLNSPAIATVDADGVPVITNTGSTFNVDGQAQGQTAGSAYTSNPAAVAGTASSNQTIVSGSAPSALSLTGSTGTIQWQSSTDNVTFANISGATSSSYFPGTMTSTTYYRAVVSSLGGCSVNTNSVVITVVPNTDSDGDGIVDYNDLDDDNDGILDTTEGQCINTSNPSTDGFDSPLVATVNGNNIQSVNPYNGWGAETGGANAFNVIRVNGAGYASGPDNAQSGNQYIDINSRSAYVYKNITLTSPAVFSGSAWFANRESSNGGYAPWSTKIEIRNETTGITVAQGNTINFTSSISDEIWYNSSINSVALPAGTYRIRMFVGNFGHLDSISYCFSKDTDEDGTPDHLDLDSDNDGCADALEGDENVIASQLTSNRISGTVDANGVPNLVNAGGAADIGSDQGQGIGEAYNAAIQSGCLCYKPAQTTGTALDTNHGITALGRAGADNSNWPMVRKGAWTVLEAKTKGFVVNRLTDAQITDIPSADLREGMMVYNITQDCLQINIDGTATGWKCFNTQTCPD